MAYNMLEYFNIDPSRIYISGASWGGRLSGRIISRYPNVFKGAIASAGCQRDDWDDEKQQYCDCLYLAQKNTVMVTTGDYDYNRPEAYAMYDYFLDRDFQNTYYIQEPGKYHGPLSGPYFEKAVNLLGIKKK